MRVISGKFKGRKILSPPDYLSLRPTTDMIKESIFNIIRFKIGGSVFLDLYAGSGAMAIEAISEGANFAVLVENNPSAIRVIRKNIEMFSIRGETTIIKEDALTFLKNPYSLDSTTPNRFDIIFLDPPYTSGLSIKSLELLANFPSLADSAIVIVEHTVKESLKDNYGKLLKFEEKTHGKIALTYFINEMTNKG